MRWLAILIVVASVRADARPRRPLVDGDYQPPPACPRTASWAKFSRCQLKPWKSTTVLYDLTSAKLVALEPANDTRDTRQLRLFLLKSAPVPEWVQSSFYAETNVYTELLAFEARPDDTYRIEMGYAQSSWVTLDEIGSRPAVLRRQFTYFCTPSVSCRYAMVACDVLVNGKAVSTFRGTATWDGSAIAIHGDSRSTNRYCSKPPGVIEPLE
jgi:hypothetical protein